MKAKKAHRAGNRGVPKEKRKHMVDRYSYYITDLKENQ